MSKVCRCVHSFWHSAGIGQSDRQTDRQTEFVRQYRDLFLCLFDRFFCFNYIITPVARDKLAADMCQDAWMTTLCFIQRLGGHVTDKCPLALTPLALAAGRLRSCRVQMLNYRNAAVGGWGCATFPFRVPFGN